MREELAGFLNGSFPEGKVSEKKIFGAEFHFMQKAAVGLI